MVSDCPGYWREVSRNSGLRDGLTRGMLAGMVDDIPIAVRMRVECARCGHTEDDTYEFDLPLAEAQPMEEYVPGKCPDCAAPVQMHLKRTRQRQ